MLAAETGHEQVILPLRNSASPIETDPARRYHRIPIIDRLLHPRFLLDPGADRTALVLDTIGNNGPAIVFPRPDDIDLIPAPRTKLRFPQFARDRIDLKPLRVAMPVRIDLGFCTRLVQERITRSRLALRRYFDDLSQVRIQILSLDPALNSEFFANAHIEVPVFIKLQPGAIL